jgi:hypothetical protein
MPNPGNQACATCHLNAPTDYSVLAANPVLHTGITSGCSQCHGGTSALTFYNNNENPKSGVLTPAHIPAFGGSDCSSCHSTSNFAVGGFGPMNMTQATHATVGATCNSCHEAGLNFYMGAANPALQLRPADHNSGQMVAPNDCSICHTTANWNSTALPAGHMPNPAGQACALCHTSAPADYSTATLAANQVLHTGITSAECGQCHGGTTPLTWYNNFTPKDAVLSPSHIPFLAGTSCGSCHATTNYATGAFGPMNMAQATHSFVASTCVTCHESGLSFYMGAASPVLQARPADHTAGQMVAPNDCSLCHTTANWNSTVLPAGHMPNPGNQACAICHTAAPTAYTSATLAANTVLHTGITHGCSSCHGAPNATPPVFYSGYTPKDAVLSPVHIPTGATACEACHSATTFTAFSGTTMSSAKHTAMFAVIGSTCDACHNKVTPALSFYGVGNLQTRPGDHNNGNKLTQDCSACHHTNGWGGGGATRPGSTPATATRSKVTQVAAAPLPGPAVAVTGTALRAQVSSAEPRQRAFSHFGVTASCASCHNGQLASGKPTGHIPSNGLCENCHTTVAWLPARFEHQGASSACQSCHNGATATGEPPQHLQSIQQCSACHNTLTWQVATLNHQGLNGTCQSCHNGISAVGKQAQHLATTQDCATCHNTSSWTVATPARRLPPLLRGRGRSAPGPQP